MTVRHPLKIWASRRGKNSLEVNRYERDRRIRAPRLRFMAIPAGPVKLDMEERYGSAASGLIEVHHVTPVSQLGEDYIIDPEQT
ncbi:MAG: hypothetical protein WDN29_04145 [Methylovirgula sp.]